MARERPLHDVPLITFVFLVLALCAQLAWHGQHATEVAEAEGLPEPLSARSYALMSLGEPLTMAKILNLWLQAFDNQPGISIPFSQLDYPRLTRWLDTILALDPRGPYPMLAAARVYGSIADRDKKRLMMEYIYRRFNEAPNRHWRWLAHAVIIAKHELGDMALALKYARALSEKATGENVPYWARDMQIIVLEDMGELEAAKVLVGALIDSGEITDTRELAFLADKIAQLEAKTAKKASENRQGVENSTENLQ